MSGNDNLQERKEGVGLRVLLGDPDPRAQAAVTRVLERDGRFTVVASARDAAETVATAVRLQPELCLLEVAMPGSGLAAAWEVTARLPETHVVMLTACEGQDELMEALEIGVSGYLLKSSPLTRLPKTLWEVHDGTFALPRQLTARVVQQLRASAPRRRAIVGPKSRLTSREWEVLDLLASGLSTRQVAEQLTLSPTAVRVHIAGVARKLGAESRAEVIDIFTREATADRTTLRLA